MADILASYSPDVASNFYAHCDKSFHCAASVPKSSRRIIATVERDLRVAIVFPVLGWCEDVS